MSDLTQLEALARAATQGEWEHRSTGIEYVVVDVIDISRVRRKEDAAYIAAANPAAILALIERVQKAERLVRHLCGDMQEAIGPEGFPSYMEKTKKEPTP